MATTYPLERRPRNESIATLLAFTLIPLSGLATDIYIPSLPSMAKDLAISDTHVQATLSLFLISYGISQLFVGSILDSFGRYRICLYALLIFALASLVIASTENIYLIYLMRIIHGITTGAIIVSKRAYFVDMYQGEKLKHYLSLFTIIWSSGPIVAPFLGGYLQIAFGWESNFYFLAFYAFLMFALEWLYSGETIKSYSEFKLKKITSIYIDMIKTSSFSLGIVMLGLAYSMVMVYNMTGPFILEHEMHLSPVIVGYSSLVLGLAWMTGGFISKGTIAFPFYHKMGANLGFQLVFAVVMLISSAYISNIFTILFFAFLIHTSAGFTFNNYFSYCLARFPKNAGIAGGLTGGITYVIVSSLSYAVVALFPANGETELSYTYTVLIIPSVIVMAIIYALRKPDEME